MPKLFAWCDAPTAPTGFGRSSKHVLHALHDAGYDITQLAINMEAHDATRIPWAVYMPQRREAGDPYGLADLGAILQANQFDMLWTTFDPEVPWRYRVGGLKEEVDALAFMYAQKERNPGFRMAGWFPVDGGPLSDYELGALGLDPIFDAPVTMSPHVYDLVKWTMELRKRVPAGQHFDTGRLQQRLRCIPHGVELDSYRIPTPEEKAAAKVRLGFRPDQFVILQVERNQQRKTNFLALSVLERLRKMLPKDVDPEQVVLYQHMIADEENQGCKLGFNLPELAWRYGLDAGVDVRWPGGFVAEEDMVRTVYAAGDAFLSVSTGEGFQYPAWEALACGMPLVLPNADARKAWFGDHHAPNVYLYDARPDSIVMRGGYGRRMALPDPSDAAKVLRKIVAGRPKHAITPERAEAGRSWVQRTANVEDVQRAWVELMDAEKEALAAERTKRRIAVPGQSVDYLVRMVNDPGLGDMVAAIPALRELRKRGSVAMELPRVHLDVASAFDAADVYLPKGPPESLFAVEAGEVIELHDLYHPERTPLWNDPKAARQETIAGRLGVDVEALKPLEVELPGDIASASRSRFMDHFGVDPGDCVGLCFQSGSEDRELPDSMLAQLLPTLRAMELTPVLLGSRRVESELVGVANATGKTDSLFLLGLLANLAAVISSDSGPAHFAAALGTPTVVASTLVDPAARYSYYSASMEFVVPDDPDFPAGEEQPHRGRFVRGITSTMLLSALRDVLDEQVDAPAISVTLPEELVK